MTGPIRRWPTGAAVLIGTLADPPVPGERQMATHEAGGAGEGSEDGQEGWMKTKLDLEALVTRVHELEADVAFHLTAEEDSMEAIAVLRAERDAAIARAELAERDLAYEKAKVSLAVDAANELRAKLEQAERERDAREQSRDYWDRGKACPAKARFRKAGLAAAAKRWGDGQK